MKLLRPLVSVAAAAALAVGLTTVTTPASAAPSSKACQKAGSHGKPKKGCVFTVQDEAVIGVDPQVGLLMISCPTGYLLSPDPYFLTATGTEGSSTDAVLGSFFGPNTVRTPTSWTVDYRLVDVAPAPGDGLRIIGTCVA